MKQTTNIVRRIRGLTGATLVAASLATASNAWARGDYVVHIDIPEIGHTGGGGGHPGHDMGLVFSVTVGIGLDDPRFDPLFGPMTPAPPFVPPNQQPGTGIPGLTTDPFSIDPPVDDLSPIALAPIGIGFDGISAPVGSIPAPGGAALMCVAVAVAARRRRR